MTESPGPARPMQPARRAALQAVIAAYNRNAYQLLRDLADALEASLAYVDRATVEAHLERVLDDSEWSAARDRFTAMDFDDHVGDHGTFRTEWIEGVLADAGVRGYSAGIQSGAAA